MNDHSAHGTFMDLNIYLAALAPESALGCHIQGQWTYKTFF